MLPDDVRITVMPEDRMIHGLQESIHEWAQSKGWWDEGKQKTFVEACMLIVTELGEAVEEFRNGKAYGLTYYELDEDGISKPEGIPSELADVFIRLADMCAFFGIDLEQAVFEKMFYNEQRSYRHGNKKA